MKDNQLYLNTAVSIARKISRDAIWHGDKCNWITSGVEGTTTNSTFFHSLKGDFYGGTSGISYFLSSAYSVNNDDIIKACALGAIRQALGSLNKNDIQSALGFYSGNLGIAYATIKAGEAFNDQELIESGVSIVIDLTKKKPCDYSLDIIDGCAGAIPVLIHLYSQLGLTPLKEYVIEIGDYLISQMKQQEVGSSWDTTPLKKHCLTGFAHGTAGFSHTLFDLFRFTGNEKYKLAAHEGILYENSHLDKQEQNWPDFREFDFNSVVETGKSACSCAWCHGAPGIGQSRLHGFEITADPLYKEDALIAITTTIRANNLKTIPNFSLCHGLFGNSDLLIEGARVLNDPKLTREAEKVGQIGIENYFKKSIPVPNGISNNTFENPEFMTGLSGIGYYYLRLVDANRFASILSLSFNSRSN